MIPDQSSEGEDVVTMLPVAAHMKLLIDTPEALYAYLSHHDYLSAAFLWLVARVAKDSLADMPESANRVSIRKLRLSVRANLRHTCR